MKKLLVLSIMLATWFASTAAQQGKDLQGITKEQVQQRVNEMTDLLSLTADQKTKIYDIEVEVFWDRSRKIGKVLGDGGAQFVIGVESDVFKAEKFRSVLTVEQFEIYTEDYIKKYVNLWSFLPLTTDQTDKIYAIEVELYKQTSEKIMKVLDNLDAQVEILLDINKLQEEKYRLVLTAEQFKKYQDVNKVLRRTKLEKSSRVRYNK